MKSELVPRIRFGEFGETWKQHTLGEYFEFKNGINADKEQYGSGIKFINVSDILNNSYLTHDVIEGSVEVTEGQIVKYEVKYGDVLFQRSSETRLEVGSANVYLDKLNRAVFGGFVIRGQAKQPYDPEFMNYLLKTSSARKDITSRSGGSTRYNIGQESIAASSVHLPSLPEQQKIAAFLTAVDGRLAGLRRQVVALERYKRGVMQGVFSGKIDRKVTLQNLCTFDRGGYLAKSDLESEGKYECIHYGELFTKYSTVADSIISRTNSERGKVIPFGAILMPTSDVTPAGLATATLFEVQELHAGGDINILKPKPTVDGAYLSYYLNYDKKGITKLVSGTTVKHIYIKDIKTLNVPLPSLPEQRRIATFLRALDDRIVLVERQLAGAEAFKRGLLQGMFV